MLLTLLIIVSSFKLLNDTETLRERIESENSCWNFELNLPTSANFSWPLICMKI